MKKIISALLFTVLIASVFMLNSCDLIFGNKDNAGSGTNTYTLEAEYIDLNDVQGAGESSSQGGVQMIYGNGEAISLKAGARVTTLDIPTLQILSLTSTLSLMQTQRLRSF